MGKRVVGEYSEHVDVWMRPKQREHLDRAARILGKSRSEILRDGLARMYEEALRDLAIERELRPGARTVALTRRPIPATPSAPRHPSAWGEWAASQPPAPEPITIQVPVLDPPAPPPLDPAIAAATPKPASPITVAGAALAGVAAGVAGTRLYDRLRQGTAPPAPAAAAPSGSAQQERPPAPNGWSILAATKP